MIAFHVCNISISKLKFTDIIKIKTFNKDPNLNQKLYRSTCIPVLIGVANVCNGQEYGVNN
jgi:hypothetical protein